MAQFKKWRWLRQTHQPPSSSSTRLTGVIGSAEVPSKLIDHEDATVSNLHCGKSSSQQTDDPARDHSQSSKLAALLGVVANIHRMLSRRRGDNMFFGAQTTTNISECQHKFTHAEESLQEIITSLTNADLPQSGKHAPRQLHHIQQQLATDGAELQLQAEIMSQSISQCRNAQWELAILEDRFIEALKDFVVDLPDGNTLWEATQDASKQDMRSSSTHSEELPQLAQDYFDAAGQVSLLRERLGEMDYEYRESSIQRELLRDQEKDLPSTDSEFELRFENSLFTMNRQLEIAVRKAADALENCNKNNIDVEALRHRSSEGEEQIMQTVAPSTLHSLRLRSEVERIGPRDPEGDSPFSTSFTGHVPQETHTAVEDWLDQSGELELPETTRSSSRM